MEDQHEERERPTLLGWSTWQWGAYVVAAAAIATYVRGAMTAGAEIGEIAWRVAPAVIGICFFVTAVDRLIAYRSTRASRDLAPGIGLLVACSTIAAWAGMHYWPG